MTRAELQYADNSLAHTHTHTAKYRAENSCLAKNFSCANVGNARTEWCAWFMGVDMVWALHNP